MRDAEVREHGEVVAVGPDDVDDVVAQGAAVETAGLRRRVVREHVRQQEVSEALCLGNGVIRVGDAERRVDVGQRGDDVGPELAAISGALLRRWRLVEQVLGLGIVGYGNFGEFTGDLYADIPGVRIAGVVDSDTQRRQLAADFRLMSGAPGPRRTAEGYLMVYLLDQQ